MEVITFAFILSVSNLNSPASRAIAEASAHQLKVDAMVTKYIEQAIPYEYKPSLKVIYAINDMAINKRLTFHWSF